MPRDRNQTVRPVTFRILRVHAASGDRRRGRLLVGPFASRSEAQAFVNKLEKEGVDGFSWTRTPAQIRIQKLKT